MSAPRISRFTENPKFETFKKEGIDRELEDKLDRMFLGTVATGEYAWAPSSSMGPPMSGGASEQDTQLEEGSDDSEENLTNPLTLNDLTINSDSSHGRTRKRMAEHHASQKIRGRKVQKKVGGAAKLSQKIDRLCDAVEIRSTMRRDLPSCSVQEVIKQLDSIADIELGSVLYFFAIKIFKVKENREIFASLQPHLRLAWLQSEQNSRDT